MSSISSNIQKIASNLVVRFTDSKTSEKIRIIAKVALYAIATVALTIAVVGAAFYFGPTVLSALQPAINLASNLATPVLAFVVNHAPSMLKIGVIVAAVAGILGFTTNKESILAEAKKIVEARTEARDAPVLVVADAAAAT